MQSFSKDSSEPQLFVFTELNDQTVPFQIIQFSIIHLFAIGLIVKKKLSGAITPGPSGPGSDGNKGLLRITGKS